ncbi:hypothetical protein SAMN06269173_11270 [Hymenobacter mucosus]|uniref:Uncharacterized protein n=1 Tax=Hymenobacter mucosus TaxID=1411120 RepID=A0A239AI44_9BACT|nr:hypothetical protein SAMN06269173_11270 [Hymenobacter mucosus]
MQALYFKRYGQHPAIRAFVEGITAAAIGAFSGAVVVLATCSLVDVPTLVLAAGLSVVFKMWRIKG